MKFTLKKIFLIAFILSLVGIFLWMFFSKIKENYDCFTKKNGNQRNKEECDNHPKKCEWKKKSGHRTSACYLIGTV